MFSKSQILAIGLCIAASFARAEVINPVAYIQKNGYHSEALGDDGKTRFFTYTERTSASRVAALEREIASLPKHVDILRVCEMMRGGAKARLIAERGIAYDVAVINYGYQGRTIACALKYMQGDKVGTQLMFGDRGPNGMYTVYVTD